MPTRVALRCVLVNQSKSSFTHLITILDVYYLAVIQRGKFTPYGAPRHWDSEIQRAPYGVPRHWGLDKAYGFWRASSSMS